MLKGLQVLLFTGLLLGLGYSQQIYRTEDIYVPNNCESVVGTGDHVLLEYEVRFKNGTRGSYLRKPSQLFHIIVNFAVCTLFMSLSIITDVD